MPPDSATPKYPNWTTVPSKQQELDRALLDRADGKVRALLEALLHDPEVDQYLSYANVVAVRRLGFNDHGPVHARIATYNALKLLALLHQAGVPSSLEEEEVGSYEDSCVAVVLGCFLHDIGMGVTRQNHESHSVLLSDPIICRYIETLYDEHDPLRPALRALVHEIIIGHMGNTRIHSLEAGVVLVADGSDMARGRSRIPSLLERDPAVGDIHRFSAQAVQRVDITAGQNKPIRMTVRMEHETGLFQVEEVLMAKVKASPIMPHIELCAIVRDGSPRFYLR